MSERPAFLNRALPILVTASVVPAIAHLVNVARVFAGRARYPMDIDWMEGGALYHAYRLLHGQPLYPPPSEGFSPYPYPPGHAFALAAVGKAFGLDYGTGRALSAVAFVAAVVALAWAAAPPGASRVKKGLFGVVAAAVTASSLPFVETRYDLVRNDSLALLFVVLSAALVAYGRSARVLAVAGLCSTLAVFTRQTCFFFVVWLAVFATVRHRRSGLVFGGVSVISAVVFLAFAQGLTHGWFWEWTIRNLAYHPVRWGRLADVRAIVSAAPLAPIALAFGAWLGARRRFTESNVLWIGVLIGAVFASLLPYAKVAGTPSDLSPLALLSPAIALRLGSDVLSGLASAKRRILWEEITLVAIGALLVARLYPVAAFVPSDADWRRARELNDQVQALPGTVLIPNHPFIAVRTRHAGEQIHDQGYQDALIAEMPGLDFPGFLARSDPDWVVLSGAECAPIRGWIFQRYRGERPFGSGARTLVGYASEPSLLLRRHRVPEKQNVRIVFDFEHGLEGWAVKGTAFAHAASGVENARFITTFTSALGDADVGNASSPEFAIDRQRLGFWIGGGSNDDVALELLVDGAPVRSTPGVASDVMFEETWNVSKYGGHSASLRLTDSSRNPFGHLLVARVHLFDVAPVGAVEPLPANLVGPVGPPRPIRGQ